MDDATLNKILPGADAKFTVKKGIGTAQHNLSSALHRHAIIASNPLHAIKDETKLIEEVFENDLVKRQIRGGGLDEGTQKLLFKKIINKKPDLLRSGLKKNIIKRIIKHFGKNKSAPIVRQYTQNELPQNKGITSIHKPAAAQTSASPLKPKAVFLNHPTEQNAHVSISRKINSGKSMPPTMPRLPSAPRPLPSNFSLIK